MMAEDDPMKLRSVALGINDSACYRIQLDNKEGWIYFSFIEPDQDFLEVPEFDDGEDEGVHEGDEVLEDERDEPMTDVIETETPVAGQNTEDMEEGEMEEPDAKRPKLK